jgi:hypothetical protein
MKLRLFLLLVIAAGSGALLGSIAGASLGRRGLFVGGVVGGLIASPCAALVAARLQWIDSADVTSTAVGAAFGFLAAAAVAVNTLSSPWGPVLSTLLVGAGGLGGRQLHLRSRPPRGS